MHDVTVSIIILTFKRLEILKRLLQSLVKIQYYPLEIIVVNNDPAESIQFMIDSEFPEVVLLEMNENIGTAGRNRGISRSKGDMVITIDDDIIGIDVDDINNLFEIFSDSQIGAVCFKVIDPETKRITNWCHHYPAEDFAHKTFHTNEITEGAVAYRKSVLNESGYYPESFFISHEGPDLACRIMNKGYHVIYSPKIVVKHYHSQLGRKNWRRYYFDTRNLLWLAVRNYPLLFGVKYFVIGATAMLIYSIRDGFFRYWLKAIIDALKGLDTAVTERSLISKETLETIKNIEKNRPNYLVLIRERLLKKGVKI